MKRILCILLSMLLLMSAAGCYSFDPENPDQPSYPVEPSVTVQNPTDPVVKDTPITPEDIVGCYRDLEEDDHYIQIRSWNDFLTIEHRITDDDGDWIWGEEFWFDDEGWSTEAGVPVTGTIQQFCIVTEGMIYDEKPMACSIELTQAGITIERDGDVKEYVREDTYPGNHTSNQELIRQLDEGIPGMSRGSVVGSWYYWDGITIEFFDLAEDGSFLYLYKSTGNAPYIYEGAWGLSGTYLVLWVELLGAYNYPVQVNLTWSYSMRYDEMTFFDEDSVLLRENGETCTWPYTPDMEIFFPRRDALGYVEYMFDEWLYTESEDGYDASYFYQIPRFVGYTEALSELNQEIYNDFGLLAENGMSSCAADEKAEWSSIYYEMFWSDTVITLVVHAYGDYNEFHKAYYYDTLTDTRLYPEDMLSLWGISQEAYLENLRTQAKQEFDYCHFEYSDEQLEELGADEYLAWTLSDDNLNVSRPLYMDYDGTLITYIQVETVYDCHWASVRWELEESVG